MGMTVSDAVIERAAEVICDASAHGIRWASNSENIRELYRRRARALAEAGLLVPTLDGAL